MRRFMGGKTYNGEGEKSLLLLPLCNVWVRAVLSAAAHAYGEGGMDSLTAGREREEIPFSFAAYVLRTCKV